MTIAAGFVRSKGVLLYADVRLHPRRLMIAPAGVGCKPLGNLF